MLYRDFQDFITDFAVILVAIDQGGRQEVCACKTCVRSKTVHRPPVELLCPLPVLSLVAYFCTSIYITSLPESGGNTVILTIVDRFSKMLHVPLHKVPSTETAELLIRYVFRLHRLPGEILSDQCPQFISEVWSEFCKTL